MTSDYTELDIDALIKTWAEDQWDTSEDNNRDATRYTFRPDLSTIKYIDEVPIYSATTNEGQMKSQQVYENTYRNDTNNYQHCALKISRETTSTCLINQSRLIKIGGHSRLKMTELPIPPTAGFGSQLSVEQLGIQEFTEKISWEVDNKIFVPKRQATKATVIIEEKTYEANFTVRTEIKGGFLVDVVDPSNNNALVRTLNGNIVEVLRQFGNNISGLTVEGNKAFYLSAGVCKFRFGVSQNVNVSIIN